MTPWTLHTRLLAYVLAAPPELVREFTVGGTPGILARAVRATRYRRAKPGEAPTKICKNGSRLVAIPGMRDPESNKIRKAEILTRFRLVNQGRAPMPGKVAVLLDAVWAAPLVVDRGQLKADGADTDNVEKLYGDALNEWAYADDCQIAAWFAIKRYTRKGEHPHVRVRIVDVSGFDPTAEPTPPVILSRCRYCLRLIEPGDPVHVHGADLYHRECYR